ncbi:hypothetical protein CIY_32380 [Butyrivibrio fibrisolvens 16/4]|nr:hypothetical protein CIY_32380 [Butyrivibrio fibrisolvens 16/4]
MGREERQEKIKQRLDENLTAEQKENLKAVGKVVENNKGNFFQSISFQNIIVNVVILAAFIIYAVISNSAMQSVKSLALVASENELICAQESAALRQDVVHISAEINRTLGQLEAGKEMPAEEFADMEGYMNDIGSHLDYLDASILVGNLPDGQERVDNLRASAEALVAAAGAMENFIISGDFTGAIGCVSGDYGTSLVATNDALDAIDEGINSLNVGFSAYLDGYIAHVSVKGYIVMAMVVVLIILSFVLSFVRINKTILGISYELQAIINNINKGKGDLTARINTKTKTELALISDCINQFLGTLQGVIRDVKDGATVLTSSADSVIVKIQSANDNVTNTSAAMEELAASMENVATTTGGFI